MSLLKHNTNDEVDVLLICALKDEYDQVLKVTKGLIGSQWEEKNDSISGRIIADAEFQTQGDTKIKVRTTYIGFMGREQAQAIASQAISAQPVKCIAMSGICAGRRGKVQLGDVVLADRLWSYDAGKSVVEDGKEVFQGDALQYRPSEIYVQHMQNIKTSDDNVWVSTRPNLTYEMQENWVLKQLLNHCDPLQHSDVTTNCPDWTEVIQRLWQRKWVDKLMHIMDSGRIHIEKTSTLYPHELPCSANFQIHVAPMTTGATVKEDKEIFSTLAGSARKVLALDMEASGLAALAEAHDIPVLIAKGVSDFGDTFKDDRYREFGARASAEVLIKLLRDTSHLYIKNKDNSSLSVGIKSTEAVVYSQDLIHTLADLYPDMQDIRSVWERAGGRASEVENLPRPRDLWQRIWRRCNNGAAVSPFQLLTAVTQDYPSNKIFTQILSDLD
jgi:nucleoside phosphorylase